MSDNRQSLSDLGQIAASAEAPAAAPESNDVAAPVAAPPSTPAVLRE